MNPVQLFRPSRLRTSRQSRTVESDASEQDNTPSIRQYIQSSPVFTFKGRGVLADRSLLLVIANKRYLGRLARHDNTTNRYITTVSLFLKLMMRRKPHLKKSPGPGISNHSLREQNSAQRASSISIVAKCVSLWCHLLPNRLAHLRERSERLVEPVLGRSAIPTLLRIYASSLTRLKESLECLNNQLFALIVKVKNVTDSLQANMPRPVQ